MWATNTPNGTSPTCGMKEYCQEARKPRRRGNWDGRWRRDERAYRPGRIVGFNILCIARGVLMAFSRYPVQQEVVQEWEVWSFSTFRMDGKSNSDPSKMIALPLFHVRNVLSPGTCR